MIKRKNIYLTIISISISIVLIEVFLRIIGFNKYEFTGYPPNYLIEDKALGFDINKNTKKMDFIFKDTQYKIWGNEIGCFDEKKNLIENEYIFIAGDSIAWGYVPYNKNWATILEKKLKKKVLNCGVPAYSTIQELGKTKKILKELKVKPTLIILQYTFSNDFLGDYLFPQYKVKNNILTTNNYLESLEKGEIKKKETESKIWEKLKYDLNENIYFFRVLHRTHSLLRKKIKKNYFFNKENKNRHSNEFKEKKNLDYFNSFFLPYIKHDKYPWIKKAWDAHIDNIFEFKKLSDSVGAEFLLIFWGDLPDYTHEIFSQALKDGLPISLDNEEELFLFLKQKNIKYLNLSKLAMDYVGYKSLTDKGEKLRNVLIWKNDNHLNIKGNQFMYEKIYNKLSNDNIFNLGITIK